MNFLVTGGAGFVGSNLCERLLVEGHAVWAFDDLNPFYSPTRKERNVAELKSLGKSFHFVTGDIRHPESVEAVFGQTRFDQVIHLAARAGVRGSLEEPVLYQEVNVIGTTNILEAARRHGVKKLVIASSSSVYGANAKLPFTESDPIFRPISPYAVSKLACEALGHVYHYLYGMDITMLRFFTAYGPRQRPDLVINTFAERILAGQPIPVFGDGSSTRNYTFISDTLDGIVACTRRAFGYEVFNIANPKSVTLARMIEVLENALGKKAKIERLPVQQGDIPATDADISKARQLLGYDPQVTIEEGLGRYVEWFRRSEPTDAGQASR
jgi:UDP-glucuronate 4-epimerase